MDVSVLMNSIEWEKIYIYFRPPLEIIVVLTKKYKCRANLRTQCIYTRASFLTAQQFKPITLHYHMYT